MEFFRRNWAILLAIVVMPLVGLLGVLQLDWIKDMGERERFRLRQGLFLSAGELAAAFQRELLLAPWSLAPPPFTEGAPGLALAAGTSMPKDDGAAVDETTSSTLAPQSSAGLPAAGAAFAESLRTGDWRFFLERWKSWRNNAVDPSIIAGIHLVETKEGSFKRMLTWKGSGFGPEADSAFVARVASLYVADPDKGRGRGSPRGLIREEDEEWNLMAVPGEEELQLLVRYDLPTLAGRVLPRLAELHLSAMSDYRFRITDADSGAVLFRSDPGGGDAGFAQPDLRLGLFGKGFVNPEFVGRNPSNVAAVADAPIFILRSGRTVKVDRGRLLSPGRVPELLAPPRQEERDAEAVWILEAVHHNGSLASVVRASTLRSAAASSGILLLLLATLVVLALANRRAQRLAARQEEFVASVTHELKTPLAVIGSAAANLADGIVRDPAGFARYGSTIGGEARRLASMIDKLLLYTRLGSGRAAGRGEVDMAALARSVAAEREAEFAALQFRVELGIADEALLVNGDEVALRLAAANLVSNVLVHAAEGGYIGIFAKRGLRGRGRRGEARAVFRVDDRGPGIPRRERSSVFEAFYRGKRARDSQEAGSGIGLNLVRRVALAHGGRVSLESTEGFGTSIAMILPLAKPAGGDGRE